ncbi:hypothetical protein ACFV9G_01535 [Nocardioides sp. NPDC059952]|uniref:hypothetical protein n=1 Tax=Nocardioides sp. NPDC059952 TaxID=3347014 RepID=UPI003654845F
MYSELPRWVIVVAVLACVVGLVLWARGPVHHHGRYVGSLGADQVTIVVRDGV